MAPAKQPLRLLAVALRVIAVVSSGQSAETSAVSSAFRAFREVYTTNAICSRKNCINPIFPGMEDLHRLEQASWIASTLQKTSPSMSFCRNAITYDPALPAPNGGSESIDNMVRRQDNAASTMYFYHTAGLGVEAWDHAKPEFGNDCMQSIWRMVCYTYFPRAEIGVQDGSLSKYMRPCKSSCSNYIRSCGVECCDESVQCVFSHTMEISATQVVRSEGYAPHDGPSSMCTGGSSRSASPLGGILYALLVIHMFLSFESTSMPRSSVFAGLRTQKLVWIGALFLAAVSLQGCYPLPEMETSPYDVPIHRVGNWRAEPDYLVKNQFIPPGGAVEESNLNGNLNSCTYSRLSEIIQCSGHGKCKRWDTKNLNNPLSFCECDTHWAGAECRIKRKSQTMAFVLSMFGGFWGLDHFYLGFNGWGLLKLFTFVFFAICGLASPRNFSLCDLALTLPVSTWWIYDIIRIGSAPVPAAGTFSTAHDLPFFAYVLTIVMFASLLGFVVAYRWTAMHRFVKRREQMTLQLDEENRDKPPPGYQPPWQPNRNFADAYQPARPGKKPIIHHSSIDVPPEFQKLFSSEGYGSMSGSRMPESYQA